MEVRVIACAFLWMCLTAGGQATRKEDLERAAELAVERSAEKAAERAVEKALESGNSTTESETIRESYSSVRKYDKSLKLPGTGYTPAQRHEYDRIMREREAAERASALLKRSIRAEDFNARGDSEMSNVNRAAESENYGHNENLPENSPPATLWLFHIMRQLPLIENTRETNEPTNTADENDRQRLPVASAYLPRHDHQFPLLYPVKVTPAHRTKPYQQLFHIVPITSPASTSSMTFPHNYNPREPWVTNAGDYSIVKANGRGSDQS